MTEPSAQSVPAPHDFRDHKQHMRWQMERDNFSGNTVPLIPQDLSQGSRNSGLSSSVLQKAASNPFVPIGMLATVGCLVGMLASTLRRNSNRAQLFMRGRCVAQGFTVAALVAGALMFGSDTARPQKSPMLSINVAPPKATPASNSQ